MKKTRVLLVTHDLAVGGLQRVIAMLCRTIDTARFEVSVLCLRAKGPFAADLEAAGVPVLQIPPVAGRPNYFAFLAVARLLRKGRFDVVHTHNTEPFMDGGLGATLAGTKTLVHTDHARVFPDKFRYHVYEHLLSYRAYRVVGVSDDTSENLIRYEHIPRRKVVTILNGIDSSMFDKQFDPDQKRRELGIAGDAKVIGLAARVEAQKGIECLLRAVALLRPRIDNITVLVAGEGSEIPRLRSESAQLGLENAVRFLGVRHDIPELLSTFDVFAMPSTWEGLPIALLEAMASGRAIVASNVGGIPTAIKHGVNGALVPPADPPALASELEALLRNDDLRRRYGAAARHSLHPRFSAATMTRQYESLYLRACA